MRNALAALLVTLLPSGAFAGVSAHLSVSPAHTLPGLPVALTVELTNTDSHEREIPSGALLMVTPSAGEPFIASAHGSAICDLTPWLLGVHALPPRGNYVLDIPVDATLGDPPWLTDPRLSRPGVYRLQLVFTDTTALTGSEISSNEAVLHVDAPSGDDAAVWQLIESARPSLCRRDIARTVLTQYPRSTYAQYAVLCVPFERPDSIAALERAIALNPEGPLADWQRMMLADLESYLDREASVPEHAQKAVSAYRSVAKDSHSPFTQALARKKLDELLAMLDEDRNPHSLTRFFFHLPRTRSLRPVF